MYNSHYKILSFSLSRFIKLPLEYPSDEQAFLYSVDTIVFSNGFKNDGLKIKAIKPLKANTVIYTKPLQHRTSISDRLTFQALSSTTPDPFARDAFIDHCNHSNDPSLSLKVSCTSSSSSDHTITLTLRKPLEKEGTVWATLNYTLMEDRLCVQDGEEESGFITDQGRVNGWVETAPELVASFLTTTDHEAGTLGSLIKNIVDFRALSTDEQTNKISEFQANEKTKKT